jgi:general secretion pathway protein H
VRLLFDRASTTGKHHRLVLDLEQGRLWAEVSDDRFYIPHEAETDSERRTREEKEAAEEEETQRRQDEASDRAGRGSGSDSLPMGSSFDMGKLEIGEFRPKRARFAAFKEVAIKPMTLKNAKIRSVYTPRVTDPITSGRAYIYFFPLGQTESAIITLSDESGQNFYSLVVHPITGRVRVYNEEIKPPRGAPPVDDEGNPVLQ